MIVEKMADFGVLERNQFLQKALDEAIDLAVIHTWGSRYIVAGCGGDNYAPEPKSSFPALVEYLEKKK